MVVLLLLPVISLSDDLIAMQGPAETDSCLRRASPLHETHPSVIPHALAIPEPVMSMLVATGVSQEMLQDLKISAPDSFLPHALSSRPPPQG